MEGNIREGFARGGNVQVPNHFSSLKIVLTVASQKFPRNSDRHNSLGKSTATKTTNFSSSEGLDWGDCTRAHAQGGVNRIYYAPINNASFTRYICPYS